MLNTKPATVIKSGGFKALMTLFLVVKRALRVCCVAWQWRYAKCHHCTYKSVDIKKSQISHHSWPRKACRLVGEMSVHTNQWKSCIKGKEQRVASCKCPTGCRHSPKDEVGGLGSLFRGKVVPEAGFVILPADTNFSRMKTAWWGSHLLPFACKTPASVQRCKWTSTVCQVTG